MYGSANFTELFSDYLKNYSLPSVLDVMPDDESGISFKQRFIDRNYYKEIGSETEELFTMHLSIRSREVVNTYLWKLNLVIENRNKMLDRIQLVDVGYSDTNSGKDEVTDTHSGTDKSTQTDNKYYNPVTDESDNIVEKNVDSNEIIYGEQITKSTNHGHVLTRKEQIAVVFGQSTPNAELIKNIIEVRNMYEEALAFMDNLFMGVY